MMNDLDHMRSELFTELDLVISQKFPGYTEEQVKFISNRVVKYMIAGIQEGYSVAIIKRLDGKVILKTLRWLEQKEGNDQ